MIQPSAAEVGGQSEMFEAKPNISLVTEWWFGDPVFSCQSEFGNTLTDRIRVPILLLIPQSKITSGTQFFLPDMTLTPLN